MNKDVDEEVIISRIYASGNKGTHADFKLKHARLLKNPKSELNDDIMCAYMYLVRRYAEESNNDRTIILTHYYIPAQIKRNNQYFPRSRICKKCYLPGHTRYDKKIRYIRNNFI